MNLMCNRSSEQNLVGSNAQLTRVLPGSSRQASICNCYRILEQQPIRRRCPLSRRSAVAEVETDGCGNA